MRTVAVGAVLCLVLALSPADARSRLEPPPLDQYHRWGALRARPGFELANVGYDSNILSTFDNEVGDFTATVFGRLDGLVLFGSRGFLNFTERLGYRGFLENPEQGFPIQRGKARITVPINRFGVFGEIEVNRDRLNAVDLESVRPERKQDVLALGVILQPGWRTEVELSRRATRWRYSDPDENSFLGQSIGERLNRLESRTQVDVDYAWRGRTRLTLTGFLGEIDFEFPDPVGRDKGAVEWGILPGIDLGRGGNLTGKVELGWQAIVSEERERGGYRGVVGRVRLAQRAGSRFTVRVAADRSPFFTVGAISPIVVDSRVGGGTLYNINRLLGFDLEAAVGVLTFPGTEDLVGRRDPYRRYEVALRFRISQNSIGRLVEYRVKYVDYRRTSNIDGISPLTRSGLGFDMRLGF